ncbi:MAG TPA: NAD(P)H-binding protein [Gemmatimonadaceae bacterium]|nr:NAD(P)H-binding protein [Gemmatimonadaceae bacterium]
MPIGRSVLLAGATGLVGRECLRQLVADPGVNRVVVLARRPLPPSLQPVLSAAKLEVYRIDFDRLEEHVALMNVDQIFCALGTTIKQAGSRQRFREIDFGYAETLARLGAREGAHHFLLVSALGANARSRVFYNRVKGELEDAVRRLPYRSVTIVRPSFLEGQRDEDRPFERIALRFARFAPKRYRPVPAARVAGALVRAAREDVQGVRVIESEDL